MKLSRNDVDIYVPDGTAMPDALSRTTHLCIGAHQDDQEFMAFHGIVECFAQSDRWFTGVCVTNGGGSPRNGPYERFTDEEMIDVRRVEQRTAASVGGYACEIQLAHPSSFIKDPAEACVVNDLLEILKASRPDVVYLHNPADKHDTHVASTLRAVAALRMLPADQQPDQVIGCEIWRSLDWVCDDEKVVMDVDRHRNLAAALSGVFDSQITGGKRYDNANLGRQAANATFFASHATDESAALSWGIDLTPLVKDDSLSITAYTRGLIDRFAKDVDDRIANFNG
ncbi:MAG: PIG-L family deacetylase [Kiritimatiellae bacterium]|nr:PIG-L family deacetylase [Kiritimatiellia bacterium]